ncbi:bifunctional alpha,alpha-trehalose-phosphate synthase (UDP-forming)/trehalose-phosphatase [Peredibacter starrii]|uniref:Bifunctional alpha,alpha-trehalose-phosphate synthase (UDP-forming)/trehalose-phosphatase n=1 Tax=Peredibacter starrii TaxID=28202 RepID=A0AAX4HT46_9BACT|nr:bifunctional alpha,alpha-trehalose-phosphate synthase (UDP-forming)/trehalose-phosphatase [Peredibacter starrii]WPU66452.1 bifunctional alpha,alpha-trehalose-phosphate synthase (UDP-forming)/trehalose-phosphatase [Peredibacter starrii]
MSRCLLVSNRLPVAFNSTLNIFTPSSGGLVSAIKGLDSSKVGFDFEWMGIMTDDVDVEKINSLRTTPVGNLPSHPIIVPKKKYDLYYNEYSNNVLWPLLHYERSMVHNSQDGWEAYKEVNQLVADAIVQEARDDDTIWVHDFQLFLVPGLVKDKRPNLKLGFFLHIPFPSSEIFRELPQRKEIISSLIRCDLVGFHDLSYLNHFRSSVQRVLGEIPSNDRMWGVYPISIDSQHFLDLRNKPETLEFIHKYKENKKEMKWILGVDRLDYIKGLLLKLQTFKEFLKRFPEERGKVQLVQIVIPSRTEVPEYQDLKQQIEQLVSSINGQYGTPAYTPIHYLYHSVSEAELSALYQLSEVLHIGSRRDGMNLVSLEYIMSQTEEEPGVVLLSEFTGAHSTLSYAVSINPWNIKDTVIKLREALHHPLSKRKEEIGAMRDFLTHYNSSDWAKVFLRDLVREPVVTDTTLTLPSDGKFKWMNDLEGKKILFFCDLDGTLAPISSYPKDVRLNGKTIELLQMISEKKNCEFVVVSGRDKEFLEEQFIDNDFEFPLAACHGAYSYSPQDKVWHNQIPGDTTKWKESVKDILELYTQRTPGSFIEDKGHGMTWHYRNSPREFADFLANKLFFELEASLTNQPVQVIRGKKVIEVKSIHANKGFFVQQWMQNQSVKPDVVVAIGDDSTDEDMFHVIQDRKDISPFCIKVGQEKTQAHYFIREQNSVNLFLQNFLNSVGN